METAEYWLMAREYGIWNAAIASLQFWTEDLDPVTLGIASEHVYTHFFWMNSSHTLCQLPEDVLFGCFIIALNAAFTQQLLLADEGYESGSTKDLPTPLHKMPCIHHVSSMEHASFNPVHTTPCRPVATANSLNTHLPDQCTTAVYPSVVTRISTPPQYAWTLPIAPEMQHQSPLMMRNHQVRMRISRQYLWMMNIGQQRWFQKEHSAYMRMGCPIMCAHTHALMNIMVPPHM